MDRNEVRQMLRRYGTLRRMAEEYEERCAELDRQEAQMREPNCTARITGMPSGNNVTRPVESAAERIQRIHERRGELVPLTRAASEYIAYVDIALEALRHFRYTWAASVEMIYVDGLTYSEAVVVANRFGKTHSTSKRTIEYRVDEGIAWLCDHCESLRKTVE